jgi:hypothetical protein
MSLQSAAQNQLESRLPKVIDARTHGIIDYCHAAFFLGMALVCRKRNRPAALAALLTGSFVLVESLLTDYPLGAFRVLPFRAHGRMDAGFAASSPVMPRLFGFKGTAAAHVFEGNGLVEAAVVGLTDFSSDLAHAQAETRRPEAA